LRTADSRLGKQTGARLYAVCVH